MRIIRKTLYNLRFTEMFDASIKTRILFFFILMLITVPLLTIYYYNSKDINKTVHTNANKITEAQIEEYRNQLKKEYPNMTQEEVDKVINVIINNHHSPNTNEQSSTSQTSNWEILKKAVVKAFKVYIFAYVCFQLVILGIWLYKEHLTEKIHSFHDN